MAKCKICGSRIGDVNIKCPVCGVQVVDFDSKLIESKFNYNNINTDSVYKIDKSEEYKLDHRNYCDSQHDLQSNHISSSRNATDCELEDAYISGSV